MTTVVVIIGEEFTHHAVKLRLVEHDDFVQQLSAQGSSEPLHIRILPWRPRAVRTGFTPMLWRAEGTL